MFSIVRHSAGNLTPSRVHSSIAHLPNSTQARFISGLNFFEASPVAERLMPLPPNWSSRVMVALL